MEKQDFRTIPESARVLIPENAIRLIKSGKKKKDVEMVLTFGRIEIKNSLFYSAFGNVTVNVVPSFRLDMNEMLPSESSMIFLAIANPNPIPVFLVVKFGTKSFSCNSLSMPIPLSVISMMIRSPTSCKFTLILPKRSSGIA